MSARGRAAPRRTRRGHPSTVARLLAERDVSLLDVVDNVLAHGVVIDGEIFLGVADVDLVYLRLSALLCAADDIPRVTRGARGRR